MSLQHFKSLYRQFKDEGLYAALKLDVAETLRRHSYIKDFVIQANIFPKVEEPKTFIRDYVQIDVPGEMIESGLVPVSEAYDRGIIDTGCFEAAIYDKKQRMLMDRQPKKR